MPAGNDEYDQIAQALQDDTSEFLFTLIPNVTKEQLSGQIRSLISQWGPAYVNYNIAIADSGNSREYIVTLTDEFGHPITMGEIVNGRTI